MTTAGSNTSELKFLVKIIAVPERATQVKRLYYILSKHYTTDILIDVEHKGALYSHLRALKRYESNYTHILVVEDDAQLTENFFEKLEELVTEFPDRMIGLYTGTGYPIWAQDSYRYALSNNHQILQYDKLLHGVAYVVPITSELEEIYSKGYKDTDPADSTVGLLWRLYYDKKILHTMNSLVDHEDEKSFTEPDRVKYARKAWSLDSPLMKEFL